MDKTSFFYILQVSILAYEGVSEEQIINQIPKHLAKAGIKLAQYLDGIII